MCANFTAFAVAVSISFLGRCHWILRHGSGGGGIGTHPASRSALKFTSVTSAGLVLNSLAMFLVADALALSYIYAVALS